MDPKLYAVHCAVMLVALATGDMASGTEFHLDWYTVDGGGDMWTTGGDYELSGTIGQPDAGVVMTGGVYELTGGFWAGIKPVHPGDTNCDGLINFADINPFVLALGGQAGYEAAYPNCNWYNADCNNDGQVNFADINAFVALLGGG